MQTLLPGITAERVPSGSRLAACDRTADSPTSPRQVLLAHYVKPPFVPEVLDIFVESMLSTRVGDDHYPGTSRQLAAWPGQDAWPPQPMVAQTRAVLDGYAAAGGRYRETVFQDSGHGPHIDQPQRFMTALREHLAQV